jgi:hypothetical protein
MKWNEKPVHPEQYTFAQAHGVTCMRAGCNRPVTYFRRMSATHKSARLCDVHLVDTWNSLQALMREAIESDQ